MNKEEFIRQRRTVEGKARTADRTSTLILFAGLFALFAFATWQQRHPSHLPGWTILCLLILLFAGVIAAAPNTYWKARRRARRNGLVCSFCHEALLGPAAQITIASNNCAYCGEAVFGEEDAVTSPGAVHATVANSSPVPAQAHEPTGLEFPGTGEEFQLRERAMQRESRSPVLFVLMLMPVLAITSGAMLHRLKANPAMRRPIAIGVLLAFAGLYAAMFLLGFRLKRRTREYGLACPACQGRLTGLAGQLAKATGCCAHCGERLFDDVPFRSMESLEKRKEFAGRKRAIDRAQKSALRILIPFTVLGLGTIFVACVFVPPAGELHKDVQTGMIIASLALIYGAGLLTLLRTKRLRRKSGLVCLSCRKPLTLVPAQIAVATGICSHCGGSIFAGGNAPAGAHS